MSLACVPSFLNTATKVFAFCADNNYMAAGSSKSPSM